MTFANSTRWAAACAALMICAVPAHADPVAVRSDGTIAFPALEFPSSPLMSAEGNRSRVEHIETERSLKGQSVDATNAALFGPRLERMRAAFAVTTRADRIAGIPVLVYEPTGGISSARRSKVLINLHGGGFAGCFKECGGLESIPVAALTGLRVISIDYREGPSHRFPDASEDVASVYRKLVAQYGARRIGIFGCSAGGILTAQSLAWFQSHGLPTPAAAGVFCAGGDIAMRGDSRIIGAVLGDGETPAPPRPDGAIPLGYFAGANPADPLVSPARTAAVLRRFPPMLVMAGTRDFALSSAVNLHSKLVELGVPAELHAWDGGRHAFFYDVRVPESREAYAVIAKFFTAKLPR